MSNVYLHALLKVFKSKVMEDKPKWSQFVDDYQIAKVDEHNSIMVMNVVDFDAIVTDFLHILSLAQ